MSIPKGIGALVLVIAVFVALLHQIMPQSVHTPSRAMTTAITAAGNTAVAQRRVATLDVENERKLRLTDNKSAVSAPNQGGSELVMLITGKGFACARISGVLPVRAGDGIYAITCEVGASYRRYVVDTRKGQIQAG